MTAVQTRQFSTPDFTPGLMEENQIMIGILTFHKSVNYGSVLQAWALQRMLTMKGIESEIIDYEPEKYGDLYDVFLKPGRPHFLVKNINRVPVMTILARQQKSFARFRRDNLRLSAIRWRIRKTSAGKIMRL